MPKLTKRGVDTLTAAGTDLLVFDDEVPRFGVRIMPSGVKSYLIQYRSLGRTRRYTFAKHGLVTADEARAEARQLLAAVDRGEDPSQVRKDRRAAPTLAELCRRYLDEYVDKRCKPATRHDYRRVLDRYVIPSLGMLKAAEIERRHIAELHRKMSVVPYQANRALKVLSKLFNLAEVWGVRRDGSNPCRHVQRYRETPRERYLTAPELRRLSLALDQAEREGAASAPAVSAFRLLIFTGCRLREIQTLKWDYVQGDHLALPDSKTGAKRVILGQAAIDELARIPRVKGNPYVITGKRPDAPIGDLQHPWRRIRAMADLADLRIHDLRHSFASSAVGLGETLPMIGKLLGHTQVQTTARYAHLAVDPVRSAADRISAEIVRAMGGER
jgi:integrase